MSDDGLKQIWRDGNTALGAWLMLRDPLIAEAAANAGFDYVCVDMQHGLAGFSETMAMLQAMARSATTPLVRVPWNEPGIIGRALDAGAMGVIIPMVNSPEEAAQAVAACRYAPVGRRSFGPLAAGTRYGPTYYAGANDRVACIPMIETKQAVDHIDEILDVPGIDAIYVGPADLSLTYGLPPAMDNPGEPFDGALRAIVESCARHGVTPGIHANADLSKKRSTSGFRMITVGFDIGPITAAFRADLATSRSAVAH